MKNETRKPVYLPEPSSKAKLVVSIGVALVIITVFVLWLFGARVSFENSRDDTCDLLLIAFDEAQMAPGWYESAGKALQACGKSIDKEDILSKTCAANRWNGYESDTCTAFEKSRQ